MLNRRATPLAEGDVIPDNVSTYGPRTAPMMPVKIVRQAVTAGMPPMTLAISMETAAVADFAGPKYCTSDGAQVCAPQPRRRTCWCRSSL